MFKVFKGKSIDQDNRICILVYSMLSFHNFNYGSGDKFAENVMSLIAVSTLNRSKVEMNPFVMLNKICLDFKNQNQSV